MINTFRHIEYPINMERRDYLKGVVSLPVIPSLPSIGKTESESEEEFWEISSGWFRKYDHGDLTLVRNGDVKHRWRYESYQMWQKATLLNSRFVADSGNQHTNYVADLFDLNIHELYIDPPYFSVVFKNDSSKVHIHQGKYSGEEYVYHVETHTSEALEGVEGSADTIEEVIRNVGEFIYERN